MLTLLDSLRRAAAVQSLTQVERARAEQGFEVLLGVNQDCVDLKWLISLHGNDEHGILARLRHAVIQSDHPGVVKQIWMEWLAQLWVDGVATDFVSYITSKHKSGDFEVASSLRTALQSSSQAAVKSAVRRIFYDVASRTTVSASIKHDPRLSVPSLGINFQQICKAHGGDTTGLLSHLVATDGLVILD